VRDSGRAAPSDMTEVLAAVAIADRLAILGVVRDDEGQILTVMAIATAVGNTRLSTSRHLRILHAAGLIDVARRGHALLHRFRVEGFEPIEDWLYPLTDSVLVSVDSASTAPLRSSVLGDLR